MNQPESQLEPSARPEDSVVENLDEREIEEFYEALQYAIIHLDGSIARISKQPLPDIICEAAIIDSFELNRLLLGSILGLPDGHNTNWETLYTHSIRLLHADESEPIQN